MRADLASCHQHVMAGTQMADKEETERRVYVLPTELVARIRAYQTSENISSEVEAARRLLDAALQRRDTLMDVLNKLKAKFAEEKNFRILASQILTGHALVKSVHFGEGELSFHFSDDERGMIDKQGKIYTGGNSYNDWDEVRPPQPRSAGGFGGGKQKASASGGGWDAPKSDLDDDIPF